MNDLTLNCPKCGGQFIFSKELAGQEIACPHCYESILLPKTKPPTAWIFAAVFIFFFVCVASIVIWKHPAKHNTTPQNLVAENTNSQAVVLQTGPLAIEQLLSVARSGDVKTVKLLLDAGVDVNARGTNGTTALMNAAYGGSLEIVKLLLEKGADVNEKQSKDIPGNTALMCAAVLGSIEITKLLLDKGADINAKDNLGYTALTSAVMYGKTDTVKLLLDRGADIKAKNDGETALIDAVVSGQTNVVQLLLDKGADINETNTYGSTLLICAAYNGQTDTVKLLLDRGADINAKNDIGQTALGLAREMTNTAIVQLLLQAGATDSPAFAVPTAAAVAPDKPEFEVISLTAKATEKNDVWWRFGYRLTIRNNGTDDNRQFFDIQFLDADGYVIDTEPVYDIIKPGTTDVITGDTIIDLPGAARASKLKAVWK